MPEGPLGLDRSNECHNVLHNLGEAHGFIHTRDRESKILHHGPHHAIGIRYKLMSIARTRAWLGLLTLVDHFLNRACGIDLHGIEVVESIDFGRVFRELLAEGIRQVVCRIGGLVDAVRS